jgi:uncharacterized protein YacL
VPKFVLDEIHHIADSPDAIRRNRVDGQARTELTRHSYSL